MFHICHNIFDDIYLRLIFNLLLHLCINGHLSSKSYPLFNNALIVLFFTGDGIKTPALSKLIINSPNLGSLTSQSVYSRLLQNYSETRHYQDYPWKLSKKLARPTSQFMMLTLSNLFDRPPNYFTNLTMLKLTGECINTRLKVSVSSEMEFLDNN